MSFSGSSIWTLCTGNPTFWDCCHILPALICKPEWIVLPKKTTQWSRQRPWPLDPKSNMLSIRLLHLPKTRINSLQYMLDQFHCRIVLEGNIQYSWPTSFVDRSSPKYPTQHLTWLQMRNHSQPNTHHKVHLCLSQELQLLHWVHFWCTKDGTRHNTWCHPRN